jgi:hypothetical protein
MLQIIKRVKGYYRAFMFFLPLIRNVAKLQEWVEGFSEQLRAAQLLRARRPDEQSGLDEEQERIDCFKCGAPLDVTVDTAYRCWICRYEGVAGLQDEDDE